MKSRTLMSLTAISVFAMAIPAQLSAQRTRYRLIDIPTLGGPAAIGQVDGPGISQFINNPGVVVGGSATSTNDPNAVDAFQWKDGVLTDLGTLSGNGSHAESINAHGWATGGSATSEFDPLKEQLEEHAVLWKEGKINDLGTLGTGRESAALYVNDAGEVVGFSTFDTRPDPNSFLGATIHAFIWRNGVMRDVGALGGPGSFSFPAGGCNNQRAGLVAGMSSTDSPGSPTHAFVWENGTMIDIPTLGGTNAFAQCANNQGQVIGQSNLAGDTEQHAFLWEHGTVTDLGTLGGTFSIPFWLNNAGEGVGYANTTEDAESHAVLWKNGHITDLNMDGDCFSVAMAINSRHQIIGNTFNCDTGNFRTVLWENGSIIDLNAAIPANSSLFLIEPDNINDRGEIVGRGLPPGCDNADACGHAFLLIPVCPDGSDGCADAPLDPAVVAQSRPESAAASKTMTAEEFAAFKKRIARMSSRNELAAVSRAPYDLIASALNTYQIRINWQEASGQNQSGFNIYRCRGCASPRTEGTKIASVGGTDRTHTDGSSTRPLTETSTYVYQVTAFSGSGESGPSNASSATTKTEPAPTNLTSFAFTRGFDDIVDLRWANNSADDDSYFLESCSGPTCTNFSVVAQLPANTTSDMQFFQFFPDITFRYRVRAHSPGGYSSYSNIRNQTLP